jgi:hypothetical protein
MEQPDPKHYNDFLQNSIQLLDALVLGIELPPEIVAAINRQTQQYYEIQEYKYRVEREAQESTRKQIEANGIAAFQRTVSEGISDSYLRWRGIEATLALAQSRNSKVVIIGSGKDGLPLILGNVEGSGGSNSKANATEDDTTPNEKAPGISAGQISTLPRPTGCNCIDAGRRHANADGCGADRASAVRSVEYQGLYATASRMAQVGHIGTGTGAGAWSWSAAQAVIGEGIAGERYD